MYIYKTNHGVRTIGINTKYSIEYVMNRIDPTAKYLIVDETSIEKRFQLAYIADWNLPNGSISSLIIDINVAISIFLEAIRIARSPLLAALDIEYIRAHEIGDMINVASIIEKKQILRDITQLDLTNIKTLEELKTCWPIDILGDNPFIM